MITLILLLFINISFSINNDQNEVDLDWDIFSIKQIYLNQNILIAHDQADSDNPVKGYNLTTGENYSLNSGGGPGELSSNRRKMISNFSNGDMLIWDYGRALATVYGNEFEYKYDLRDIDYSNTAGLHVLNDSTVVKFLMGGDVLEVIDIGVNHNSGNIVKSIPTDVIHELEVLEPWGWMRQLLLVDSYDGELFFGFEFSSYVFKIDANYDLHIFKDQKYNIPIPTQEAEDAGFLLPDSSTLPPAAVSMAVDSVLIYVLINPNVMSKARQMRYILNPSEYTDKISHTTLLMTIDKATKDTNYYELDQEFRSIVSHDDSLILLNTMDMNPKYKFLEKEYLYNYLESGIKR